MSPYPADIDGAETVEYEYTKSIGAWGVHAHGQFDALVGFEREIWIGGDGSGLIRGSRGPVEFFTEDGKARWEAAGSRPLTHGRGLDLYGPGCLSGSRTRRARLAAYPGGLGAAVSDRGALTLRTVQDLLNEAVVDPDFCRELYAAACQLSAVHVNDGVCDQLGRAGDGLVRTEGAYRIELIFATDKSEMLAYQWFLAEDQPYAPAGTLSSWSAFLARRIEPALPADVPPIPRMPADRSHSGRCFQIRPGFSVTTGWVEDPLTQLAVLHAQGVLTDQDYESAKAAHRWRHFDDPTALAWRELGLAPHEALELTKSGRQPQELAASWRHTGIPATELGDWIGSGLMPEEATHQRASGVTRNDAAAMRGMRNLDRPQRD